MNINDSQSFFAEVYPNPVNLFLYISLLYAEPAGFKIIDFKGKTHLQGKSI